MIDHMVPQLVSSEGMSLAVLHPGIHTASPDEVKSRYAINTRRRDVFEGVVDAARHLRSAGCARI